MSEQYHPRTEDVTSPHREQVKKERRRSLLGFATSLIMHAFGGYGVEHLVEHSHKEDRLNEREAVKDTLFLPATEEEFIDNLIEQSGAQSLEEIQAHPQFAKNIDMGKFFLQSEFLENKLDAKKAKKAYLNLEMKRKVFKQLATEIPDRRIVVQEILNEIADPQIALISEDQKKSKKDYLRGKALLSSYLLDGTSNCYGATRAFEAIAGDVYPDMLIELNEFDGHVRPAVTVKEHSYIAETGAPLSRMADNDMSGSLLHKDARLSFLGFLGLKSQKYYFPKNSQAIDSTASISYPDSEYENTKLANFDAGSADSSQTLRKFSESEVPREADRKRVDFTETATDASIVPNKQVDPIPSPISQEDVRVILKRTKLETKREMVEALEKQEKKDHSTTTETGTKETAQKHVVPATPEYTERMQKMNVLLNAQTMIPAFIRESNMYPERSVQNEKEITLWFTKLENAGMLDEYIKRQKESTAKLEPLRALPGDQQSPVLQAELLIDDYIKKYQESKDDFLKELGPSKKKEIIDTLIQTGHLSFSTLLNDNDIAKYPQLEWYSVPSNEMQQFVEDEVIPALNILKAKGKQVTYMYMEGDLQSFSDIFEFYKKYPPTEEMNVNIVTTNSDYMTTVLEEDKTKKIKLRWMNPKEGQQAGSLAPYITQDRVTLFDDNSNKEIGGMSPPNEKFSILDEETGLIKNVHEPKEIEALGKSFVREYIFRKAIFSSGFSTDTTAVKGATHEPLNNQDMGEVGRRIAPYFQNNSSSIPFDVTNVSSLEWIKQWEKLGLTKKIDSWKFLNIPVQLSEIEHTAIDNITIDGGHILDWGKNIQGKSFSILTKTTFTHPPTLDFFQKNHVRITTDSEDNLEKILTVLAQNPEEVITVAIYEKELRILMGETTLISQKNSNPESHLLYIARKLGTKEISIGDFHEKALTNFSIREFLQHNIKIISNDKRVYIDKEKNMLKFRIDE